MDLYAHMYIYMKGQTYTSLHSNVYKCIDGHVQTHTQCVDSWALSSKAEQEFCFLNWPFALKCFSIYPSIGLYLPLLVKVNSWRLFKLCLVSSRLWQYIRLEFAKHFTEARWVVLSTLFGFWLTNILFQVFYIFHLLLRSAGSHHSRTVCSHQTGTFCPPVDGSRQGVFSRNPPSPHTRGINM